MGKTSVSSRRQRVQRGDGDVVGVGVAGVQAGDDGVCSAAQSGSVSQSGSAVSHGVAQHPGSPRSRLQPGEPDRRRVRPALPEPGGRPQHLRPQSGLVLTFP